jgi:oxygen-independent coproporphyrinogen-3 oxidase
MEPSGLYIHIPFCRSKCCYCGFYSITSLAAVTDFLKALFREMDIYRNDFHEFDTIYIGGGTPSVIPEKDLGHILEAAADKFTITPRAEITIEANPADIDLSGLRTLRRMGFNRINLGIQSFDDDVLNFLGRRHDRRQAVSAVEEAGKAVFENTGIDLTYGIPGQESAAWADTLRLALSFNPGHLSCYQLTIEPGTPLSTRNAKGEVSLPGETALADLFFQTTDIIEMAGYVHYEVSNYARNLKMRSRHNQKYWNHTPYLGLGPSAHSFQGRKRWWNRRDLSAYIKELAGGIPPVDDFEQLTEEQLQLEAVFLGLRTSKGINLIDYERRYRQDLLSEKRVILSKLVQKGLIEIKNDRLQPTREGLAVADSLALI